MQERGKLQAGWQSRGHVLGGVHGDVDAPVEQRLLDLLGEEALAAGFRKRPVLDAVATGRDDLDGEGVLGHSVRRHQQRPHLVRLCQRQRAAASAYPEQFCLHAARTVIPQPPPVLRNGDSPLPQ